MTLVTLRAAQSKILKVWNNIDKRITKYHVEAADNAKFLGAIEKTSHSIYLEDPSELKGNSSLWFKMPNLIRKFVLMLYGFYIIFLHNTSLSKHQRFQEKWKRPTKVMKAKSKAREWIILDFHDFLAFLEQLGVVY